ncbi:DUF2968 domain-containing protein [Acidithiobacillus sp.]|uniref:DUF2968 domain-containing protein n=1 Tax=Acidithiobacillus sp. TaxID=1872118 RepID=UPI0026293904|nr:DUF2968 domain-containing protein [Acidithiobacillus sp.]MDD2748895.1 DUF2968 domain-containing protein [Acidithiobacillus sp.]MDD5278813.1 DUF2968 domain-containing protein [Acidithiobacillus sp.]
MRIRTKQPAIRILSMTIGMLAGIGLSTGAYADSAATTPQSDNPAALPSSAPTQAPALTQHVLSLIKTHQLVELRTIYNGPFAAAMFFNPQTLDYSVVLLKHHDFWWVGETADGHKAEQLYTKLATQTIRLAAPDLAKIQLDARIAVAKRSLAAQQKREEELAQQISAQQKIVQAGTAAQGQLLQEAEALDAQRKSLEEQLSSTNSAIAGLQSKAQAGPSMESFDNQVIPHQTPTQPYTPQKSRIQIRATAHP